MKISVVMQSYLHDYPGSRSNPEQKFIRAVNSFLSQTYENKELVIVADGCSITPEIFYKNWANNKQIKFAFIHKTGLKMYETENNQKFFRGMPKKIGCSLADGELITYMDSDDLMLSERLTEIASNWSTKINDFFWSYNQIRLMPQKYEILQEAKEGRMDFDKPINLEKYGIQEKFYPFFLDTKFISGTTNALVHKNNLDCKWRDCLNKHEDFDFLEQLISKYRDKGFMCNSATYALCHFREQWDY